MNIILCPRSEKQLRKLPKFDQLAVAQKIRLLTKMDVRNEEKLSRYTNMYRVRVGDYRIVYKKSRSYIYIVLIRHRRDVYRMIKEILG